MPIRFIHAADFHLDRPFKGIASLPPTLYKTIVDSPFSALHKTVTHAIEQKVDFVLISGDLYDQGNPSLRAEQRFLKEMERLSQVAIPVYLIHGNHDPLDERRLTHRLPNLHIFQENLEVKRFEKSGEVVHLYGFSYPTRHIIDNRTHLYKKQGTANYHIGLLHGSVKGNSEHDVYAPFEVQQLIDKGFDYWALGHIHKRQTLSSDPPILYPGTPQGLSIKESGPKGVQLVTLTERGSKIEFLSTSTFVFETSHLDLSEVTSIEKMIETVDGIKQNYRNERLSRYLRLNVVGQSPLHEALQDIHTQKELLQAFQDGEEEFTPFVWIGELRLDTSPNYPRSQWQKEAHFLGDLIRLVDQTESLSPLTRDLFHHSKVRKYVSPIEDEDQEQILRAAEQLLIKSLYESNNGGGKL